MKLARLKARRWLIARKGPAAPLSDLIHTKLPASSNSFATTSFVSLDIETTGLDASKADMLSVGWVVIRNGKIDLGTAETYIVQPSGDVGDSASVHGLTDTLVETGLNWGIVLDKIITVLAGRVLVVHHSGLDKVLLDRMCLRRYGCRLPVPVIDTLHLEHRRMQRIHHIENKKSLRLSDVRESYNLPTYNAHDCLVDAIATAEVLIAIAAHHRTINLGDLLS